MSYIESRNHVFVRDSLLRAMNRKLERNKALVKGPLLEVLSKNYGSEVAKSALVYEAFGMDLEEYGELWPEMSRLNESLKQTGMRVYALFGRDSYVLGEMKCAGDELRVLRNSVRNKIGYGFGWAVDLMEKGVVNKTGRLSFGVNPSGEAMLMEFIAQYGRDLGISRDRLADIMQVDTLDESSRVRNELWKLRKVLPEGWDIVSQREMVWELVGR